MSFVWGDLSKTTAILVIGVPVQMMDNVFDALEQFCVRVISSVPHLSTFGQMPCASTKRTSWSSASR